MSRGYIVRSYRAMSSEDRRTFDRWLKANAVAGVIIAAGLIAMAWAGFNSAQRDPTVAENAKASNLGASGKHLRQSGLVSR